MFEIACLLALGLMAGEFWQRREQAELAERLIRHYCNQQAWQLLSVCREGSGWPLLLAPLARKRSLFVFEYSCDGQQREEGELYLTGLRQPLFRLPAPPADNVIPFPERRSS